MPSERPRPPLRRSNDRVEILVAEQAIVALEPGRRRVRVGLVMPVVDRVIDVSVQPASARTVLEDAGRRARAPATSVEAAARRALADAAGRASAWQPPEGRCLTTAFGGVAFPLLAAAYDTGAAPLHEVPRWAEPVLAATTVGEGAAAAFGERATRPVRRALVEAIRPLPSGRIDLAAMALALIGQDVLEPDRLARLLASARVPQPASDLPDPATLRSARSVIGEWGPVRAERVLVEAAGRVDGTARLLDTVRYARQLGDHGPPQPLANNLDALHDAHRALMRSAVAAMPDRVHPPEPAPVRRPHRRPPHRALPPPITGRRVRADTAVTMSTRVRRLDGCAVGDLQLVLPHTAGDLDRWGRLLGNCLGDFGPAAATGRSVVIGVLRANRLTYALELTPGGAIRQFSGTANRRPTDADRRAVVHALVEAGVLDVRATVNRPWLAGLPDRRAQVPGDIVRRAAP